MPDQDKSNQRRADIMKMSSWRTRAPKPASEEPTGTEAVAGAAGSTPAGPPTRVPSSSSSSSPAAPWRRPTTAEAAAGPSSFGSFSLAAAAPWRRTTTTTAAASAAAVTAVTTDSGVSPSLAAPSSSLAAPSSSPAPPWRRATTTPSSSSAAATANTTTHASPAALGSGPLLFSSAAQWRRGGTTTEEASSSSRRGGSNAPHQTYFKPMGRKKLPSEDERAALARAGGFSLNYQGDMTKPRNLQTDPADNCSLFLTNLPPDCTTPQLITALTELRIPGGKIYATNIICPEPPLHSEAAANVSFFTREAAEVLLSQIERGLLVFGGYRIGAIWDKNAVRPADGLADGDESRVLLLRGRARDLHIPDVEQFIASKGITYQVESITCRDNDDGTLRDVEWRFGSYRMQAQAVKLLFLREMPEVQVCFGRDPCAA